jgi:hypothetical protein
MNKPVHTPGPWEPSDLDDDGINHPAVYMGEHCIATVWAGQVPRREAAANARLIAAAPALLDALQIAANWLEGDTREGAYAVLALADQAVSEALGLGEEEA